MSQNADTLLTLQFSQNRLNDMAGDPYWVDVTQDEAKTLVSLLETRLAAAADTAPVAMVLR
ncbi:hypothetical protein [Robbsia sp. KACC 23696]|uniref:hypothetical protein n=1 Tax=Robbsia sp. KACC 23696 TaxID=3149231 RepID=UPI00325BCA21